MREGRRKRKEGREGGRQLEDEGLFRSGGGGAGGGERGGGGGGRGGGGGGGGVDLT